MNQPIPDYKPSRCRPFRTVTFTAAAIAALLSGTSTAVRAVQALPAGAVGYWSFDNVLTDGSGNANTLKSTAGTVQYSAITAMFGLASLYVDGGTTLGTLSGLFPTGVPTGAAAYTVAAWIKADTGCSLNGGWIGYGNDDYSQANNFRFNAANNSVWEYWYANDFGATLTSGTFFDGWHSVVGTWDGTTEKIYLDGVATTRSPNPTGLDIGTAMFVVGRSIADANFKGWIDDLLILNRAMTEAEVTTYQTSGALTGASVATQSTVSATPALVSVDNSSTITVTLKNDNDNLLLGKAVTLVRTGGTGPGTPAIATVRGTTGNDGSAAFTVACTTPGIYVFTATDSTDNVVVNQKATVTVTAGAATTLAFTTQPGGGIAGVTLAPQPKVILMDAHGNTVTGTAQDVTVAIQHDSGPGSMLSGTKTVAVDAATGVAAFSGLIIDLAGTGYTLTATGNTVATSAGVVVSNAFDIAAADAGPPGYAKSMVITFPGYTGTSTLTAFPVLVRLNTDILGFTYSDFLAGSNDIRFTDLNGNELPYEIDTWNTSDTSLIWVKIPVFQSSTVIIMRYGKSGDTAPGYSTDGSTWANDFRAVWHMNATSAPDSTGHDHSGTAQGTVTTTESSQIGTAGDFTGGGWINVPGHADFTFTGDFTWSAWVYASDANNCYFLGNWNQGYCWGIDYYGDMWSPITPGTWGKDTVNTGFERNSWHYWTVRRSGTQGYYTVDGRQTYTWTPGVGTLSGSPNTLQIGNDLNPWNGMLDEVRMSGAARSLDWIQAEYNNQFAPGTFASITVSGATSGNDYTSWATTHGVPGGTSGDSNHDGVPNGIAYFMGLTGPLTNPGLDASNMVTWPMSETFLGTYEVQTSSDLDTWNRADPQPTRDVDGNLVYTLPFGLGTQFVRLVVTPN